MYYSLRTLRLFWTRSFVGRTTILIAITITVSVTVLLVLIVLLADGAKAEICPETKPRKCREFR